MINLLHELAIKSNKYAKICRFYAKKSNYFKFQNINTYKSIYIYKKYNYFKINIYKIKKYKFKYLTIIKKKYWRFKKYILFIVFYIIKDLILTKK